jgi:DNA primase
MTFRVLWPKQGVTKRDLAEFYAGIADRILPHVVNRPLTLVRCPSGSDGACFAYFGENEQSDRSNLNRACGPI